MKRTSQRWIAASWIARFLIFPVFLLCQPRTALSFNSLTHSQITQSAFNFMAQHSHLSNATDLWLSGTEANHQFMKQVLIRAIVDADFKADLWITGALHSNVPGGIGSTGISIFTTLFHHLNVVAPGTFWENDGYAYRHTSGTGNDSLLATFSAKIVGSVSTTLGGKNAEHPARAFALPPYKLGFKGTSNDWNRFFFGNNDPTKAVFPPASVPAQLAYDALIASDRAAKSFVDNWSERFPLISGALSEEHFNRFYWRGEIESMPRAFDLLGLTLHMTQDMAMPHHTEGIASFCHPEIEVYLDQLTCAGNQGQPLSDYEHGTFLEDFDRCQSFYDANLVSSLIAGWPALQTTYPMSVSQRMQQIALISSRWRWGATIPGRDDSITTQFPDGSIITARDCAAFIGNRAVQAQLKYQYNLAVASTVVLFEVAARDYESVAHIKALPSQAQGLPFYMTPQAALAPPAPFLSRGGAYKPSEPSF